MAVSPVIVVTGAVRVVGARSSRACPDLLLLQNRGVGLGIAHLLTSSKQAYTLYLTSTSGNDLPSPSNGSSSKVHPVKLDVSSADDVKEFAASVEKKHGKGGVEAIINNAGINIDHDRKYSKESVKQTLAVNLYGTENASPKHRRGYPG